LNQGTGGQTARRLNRHEATGPVGHESREAMELESYRGFNAIGHGAAELYSHSHGAIEPDATKPLNQKAREPEMVGTWC
jgi:hypothetical protein